MTRALVPLLLLLAACEPADPSENFTITLAGGEPTWRIDLNPSTVAADVDTNVDLVIAYDGGGDTGGMDTGTSGNAEVYQYRIAFAIGGDEGPAIAGSWVTEDAEGNVTGALEIAPGSSASVSVRAAAADQLAWAAANHGGGETQVSATVTLEGYVGNQDFSVSEGFTFIFSEYR